MKYLYNDKLLTIHELSEISGIAPHTIRDRLRRGYPLEEALLDIPTHTSVKEFSQASWYKDWIGMTINDLYTIYWKWCVSHEYQPVTKQCLSRQLMKIYPMLKIIPLKTKDDGSCHRVIRMRGQYDIKE